MAALELISECAATADEASLGLEELESECPGLERALAESGDLPLLATAQREQLTTDQLIELRQIAERYRTAREVRAPRPDAVQPILKELERKPPERVLSWWERLQRWLRRWVDDGEEGSRLPPWLADFKLPRIAAQTLLYGSIALVVVLAIIVLMNELRAAGAFKRRASRADAGIASAREVTATNKLDSDLDAIAPAQRAPLLLKLLVATLVRSGRLHTERSLTHRELGLRATFDNDAERACFQRLAQLAERTVYGAGMPPPADHDAVIAAGRALHTRLSGASA